MFFFAKLCRTKATNINIHGVFMFVFFAIPLMGSGPYYSKDKVFWGVERFSTEPLNQQNESKILALYLLIKRGGGDEWQCNRERVGKPG